VILPHINLGRHLSLKITIIRLLKLFRSQQQISETQIKRYWEMRGNEAGKVKENAEWRERGLTNPGRHEERLEGRKRSQ